MDGLPATRVIVERLAPDHAGHVQDDGAWRGDEHLDVRCSCGVGLTFSLLQVLELAEKEA